MSKETSTDVGTTDLWQNLLRETAAKSKIKDSNLIVMGDRLCGKKSLLTKMRFRSEQERNDATDAASEAPFQFPEALSFSYFTLFDPDDPDSDSLGLPTKVNVWTCGDSSYQDLLPTVVGNSDLAQTAVVIVLNLSKPHSAVADLHKWLEIVETTFKQPLADLPLSDQAVLKDKIQNLFNSKSSAAISQDPDEPESKSGDGHNIETPEGAASVSRVQVERNLGVPIIVVGTQSDHLIDQRSNPLTSEQCDFLQMHLRRVCLRYGAALCYTSTVRGNANCNVLQRYILHRLYPTQFNFTEKPEVIQKDVVFTPAGWDTTQRIEEVMEGAATVNKDASFNDVIKFPVGEEKVATQAETPSEPTEKAMEYQAFLTNLLSLSSSSTNGTPKQHGHEGRKKKVAYLVNQANAKTSTPTGGAAALLRRGATSPKGGKVDGVQAGGEGTPSEPDHTLLKSFFRGLMNRTGERPAGGANAKEKKVKAKARKELSKMNGASQ